METELRRKLIVGNWKMNGSRRTLMSLLAAIRAEVCTVECDVVVCPPFPFMELCAMDLASTAIRLGAQNMSEFPNGAYTGEVSAAILHEFGCKYVLIGHSERRAAHGESDDIVARKVQRAIAEGLVPIICVGETWEERGYGQTRGVLTRQVSAVAATLSKEQLPRLIVAYEPVWAIGTGMTATPAMAQDAHTTIRGCLAGYCPGAASQVRILYGGSVKPDNASQLLSMPDIDGALVGGASLDAHQFVSIVEAASLSPAPAL